MNSPQTQDFYNWKHALEEDNILSHLLQSYYDTKSIYSAKVNDTEYSYSIGTHPQLIYPHFSEQNIKKTDFELDIETDKDTETYINRLKEQIAVNLGHDVSETDSAEDLLWNQPSYIVSGTSQSSVEDSLSLNLGTSEYYLTVSRGQKLEYELIDAILESHLVGSRTIVSSDVFDQELPLRDKYFNSVKTRLQKSDVYRQGIGGTTLTILKHNNEYYLITAKRSSDVYSWPNLHSVFPAGVIQPNQISTNNVLRNHLLHSYGREFFNIEEPTLSSKPVGSLNQLIESGEVYFDVTGAGIDLLYGNYQVSTVLLIEYQDYIKFIQDYTKESFEHTQFELIPLSKLNSVIDSLIEPSNITPISGFALLNGLHYADRNYDQLNIPIDIEIDQYQPYEPEPL